MIALLLLTLTAAVVANLRADDAVWRLFFALVSLACVALLAAHLP